MSVFRNLDCLSLVVCSNTTLLKLQTVLFLFFSKFCASKSGVRLIYGCGLYTDVYGTPAGRFSLGIVFHLKMTTGFSFFPHSEHYIYEYNNEPFFSGDR